MRTWLLMGVLVVAGCKKEPMAPVGLATPIPHAAPRRAPVAEEPEAVAAPAPTPASDLVPIDNDPVVPAAAPAGPADLAAIPDPVPPAPVAIVDAGGAIDAGAHAPKRTH